MKEMADEVMAEYAKECEPGTYQGDRQLRENVVGGGPTTPQRSRLRRHCSPQGPVGFLSESIRLQASSMDRDYNIRQWNQPSINILGVIYQLKSVGKAVSLEESHRRR